MTFAPLLTSALLSVAPAALPPITSVPQALAQLGAEADEGKVAALQNVAAACAGKYRRELRDKPELLGRVSKLASMGTAIVKRAALDAARCFSPRSFAGVVEPLLSDPDPSVVAYAAEVSARLEEPALVDPLLAALAPRVDACLRPGLDAAALDACVWLTYAPGALLAGATEDARAKASDAAARMFESPYPKVREVAVETVASARVRANAAKLSALIDRETKKGGFDTPNDGALITRFKQRLAALGGAK
ncbi:hypothetical protein L6R52_27240 [Myxococcota bacterium]|nr:hypothetical protein [Myxococcota bacterium]